MARHSFSRAQSRSIVCTQLTKAGAFAGGASGDRIADLDLTVGHDDPHHQPFDQLALLLPGGLIEPLPHTAAELLHAQANARNLALAASSRASSRASSPDVPVTTPEPDKSPSQKGA